MSISGISIRRPLMMIMIILAISMFGVVGFLALPIDKMPSVDFPFITVQTIYPGASPDQIEENVVKLIEEQVSTISGIKNLTSYCLESVGYIILEFNSDIDANIAAIDVKDKIDQILVNLPDDLEKPIISKFDPFDEPIVSLAVTGDCSPEELRQLVDNELKDRFAQISGVAKVDVRGGREREIHVNLNTEKMAAHNLTIFQVTTLLTAQNFSIPGGYLTGERKEYSIKVDGEFNSLEDIKNLQIPVYKSYGRHQQKYEIRLSEVAEVIDGYKEIREMARFNGKETVQITITKSSDANASATADKILKKIEDINSSFPEGYKIDVIENTSIFIKNTVNDTYGNIVTGIVLTALILLLFLFDWRLAIIAAVTMPVSLIMAMVGVTAMGFTLNMITLMALTISVGVLVTNSIVVIENVVRHRNTGQDVRVAAQEGSDEIFMSVLASTLTNLAVFIPIASMTGMIGSVFKSLGLTIVFATLASIFLSFTLTPLMASRMLKQKKVDYNNSDQSNVVDRLLGRLDKAYEVLLGKILNHKTFQVIAVVGVFGFFMFTMIIITPKLGSEFAPDMDEGIAVIDLEMPSGTPFNETQKQIFKIEELMKDQTDLIAISSSIGGTGINSGVHIGTVKIQYVPENDREETIFEKVNNIRPMLAEIPDAQISVASSGGIADAGQGDIVIEVKGLKMDKIIDLSEEVIRIVENSSNIASVKSSWKGEKPEILITPDRERLEHYGLSPNLAQATTIQMLGAMLRYNITGDKQAVFKEKGEEYPIRVSLEESSRKTVKDIETMQILTPRGPVPLKAIASVKYSGGISSITRKDRQRMVELTVNMSGGNVGKKISELTEKFNKIDMEDGYEIDFAGDQDMQKETFSQLGLAAFLAVALTFMLLVALLESITMAIVIMLTIPLGLIGVIWSLFLTGNSISMISLMSVVMLIGIVVNNAILLIDYARHQRIKTHISAKEAIVKAAGIKLKAIIMSNLAIIISMLPMALALGSGGSFRAPFAITAIGGVLASTIFTFFIIPIFYLWTAPSMQSLEKEFESEHEL